MKSFSKLLVIATVTAAALGCSTSDTTSQFVATCTGGYLGNADRTRPLICVSVNGMSATPLIDPIHVYAKGRNGAATQIAWASPDRTADLHIAMTNPSQNCVKNIVCPRKQACFATIVDNAPAGAQCEYQISNGTGGKPMDPIIIIETCCADQ
ncbi:MAG TPA: hypothetical protein VF381_10850 [Thermoanaerobaculia bacterium]